MAQVDQRLPWFFVKTPAVVIMADYVSGCSNNMREILNQNGFTMDGSKKLPSLPEATASGPILKKLATKRYRADHKEPEKVGSGFFRPKVLRLG